MSQTSNVCNAVEGHCFQAMKIVHHHANGRFDWLISGHHIVNPSRETIPVLSGKYRKTYDCRSCGHVLNRPFKEYGNKRRTDKTRTKLTDTTPITPTSIHTNRTIKASKQGVLERILPLKQLT